MRVTQIIALPDKALIGLVLNPDMAEACIRLTYRNVTGVSFHRNSKEPSLYQIPEDSIRVQFPKGTLKGLRTIPAKEHGHEALLFEFRPVELLERVDHL